MYSCLNAHACHTEHHTLHRTTPYVTPHHLWQVPGWREHEALHKLDAHYHARVAAFFLAMPRLHPVVDPFRYTDGVTLVINRTLFVHGGVVPSHLDMCGGLDGLNTETYEWVANAPDLPVPPIMNHPKSPVWMRQFSSPPNAPLNETAARTLKEVLEMVDCDTMVVGHTPQVRCRCSEFLVCVGVWCFRHFSCA